MSWIFLSSLYSTNQLKISPQYLKKIALLLVDRSKKHANSTDQQCFAPHMSKFFRKRICKINREGGEHNVIQHTNLRTKFTCLFKVD